MKTFISLLLVIVISWISLFMFDLNKKTVEKPAESIVSLEKEMDKILKVVDTIIDRKPYFGLPPKEFEILTRCLGKNIKIGSNVNNIMHNRVNNITNLNGKYYVYYKEFLVDIVDSKKEFKKNISYEKE